MVEKRPLPICTRFWAAFQAGLADLGMVPADLSTILVPRPESHVPGPASLTAMPTH